MAGIKIVDLPALGRDLISTDLLEVSLNGSGSRKITGQEIMNASKLAVGSTPIVSGTVGRLLFQNTGDVLGQSANLFWDDTNARLGIGISSPSTTFAIGSGGINRVNLGIQAFEMYTPSSVRTVFLGYSSTSGQLIISSGGSNDVNFLGGGFKSISTGNFAIGSTTDAGFRLDVNGTARVQNTTTITKGGANYITFEPSANATTPFLDMFFSGQVSTRISLGTTSSTRVFLFRDLGTALGMGIDCGAIFSNSNAILIGGAEQKVQIAGTTNNYLQFTQAGTANRGTIGFASGQSYMQIRVNGATDLATGTLSTAFFSTGNIGINTTTDAGFRLDVNGTARVQGALTLSAASPSITLGGDLTITSTLYPSRVASYDILNSNLNLLAGGFGEGMFIGSRLTGSRTSTTFVSPDGLNAVGSAYISPYLSANGNVIIRASNNGNRSIQMTGLGAGGSVLIGNITTGNGTQYTSILTLESTTQGFLPPRMTNAQRAAIASPAVGLIVYCTDSTEGLYVYKSTGWTFMV